MKYTGAFSLAIFLGSMPLLAQGSGRNNAQLAVAHPSPRNTSCPIAMQAQPQLGAGNTLALKSAGNKEFAQRIHLTLNNSKYAEIIGIQITVHGLNATGRMSPANASPVDASEITKTIHLKIKIGPQEDASTDLVLPAFTAVNLVSLDSVNYASGSAWHSSAGNACHVVPDGTMLISSR